MRQTTNSAFITEEDIAYLGADSEAREEQGETCRNQEGVDCQHHQSTATPPARSPNRPATLILNVFSVTHLVVMTSD